MKPHVYLLFLSLILSTFCCGNSNDDSVFEYEKLVLKPYEWQYRPFLLPDTFSSVTLYVETNVHYFDPESLEKLPKRRLPVICLQEGSLPLPDVDNNFSSLVYQPLSNGFTGSELCFPARTNITLRLTNEQIFPGIWYLGFFNRIGPTRTQSKMINRGKVISFIPKIRVEECNSSTLRGPECNNEIKVLSCDNGPAQSPAYILSCAGTKGTECVSVGQSSIYSLEIKTLAKQLILKLIDVEFMGTGTHLMCYARQGAVSSTHTYDFSANLSATPLIIDFPKYGLWYFSMILVSTEGDSGRVGSAICFSLYGQILQCPPGKAGANCSSDIYPLQIQSFTSFQLEQYFTTKSMACFLLDVRDGVSGQSLGIRLAAGGPVINFELYARYSGLTSESIYDFYAMSTTIGHRSTNFPLYEWGEEMVNLYVPYVREGSWVITLSTSSKLTTARIATESCPNNCSGQGSCKSNTVLGNSLPYSYCSCDLDHGGFGCSVTIVSRLGHLWHSFCLVGSNAAALLPAVWCLSSQAYVESVVYMSSGIASGIYHYCDSGNACLLTFEALQVVSYMDFWLSFVAVVSTFVFMTHLGDSLRGALQMIAAFITSLLARSGPTKSSNITTVIAIGAAGILLGVLIEVADRFRTNGLHYNMITRQALEGQLQNYFQTFPNRFRWKIVISAFIFLAFAMFSWNYETPDNYWVWHSFWHINIYIAAFLFVFSKADLADLQPVEEMEMSPLNS